MQLRLRCAKRIAKTLLGNSVPGIRSVSYKGAFPGHVMLRLPAPRRSRGRLWLQASHALPEKYLEQLADQSCAAGPERMKYPD